MSCKGSGSSMSRWPRQRMPEAKRRCHDCGRVTTDYRCEECLRAWRVMHGVPPDGVLRDKDF